jgi:hypothetical protein
MAFVTFASETKLFVRQNGKLAAAGGIVTAEPS